MNHDLLSREERMRGLRNHPRRRTQGLYLVQLEWRRSVRQIRDAAWQETLSLREARLLGLGVVLIVLCGVGIAWVLSLMGWIR
jgi:hypothetical protein